MTIYALRDISAKGLFTEIEQKIAANLSQKTTSITSVAQEIFFFNKNVAKTFEKEISLITATAKETINPRESLNAVTEFLTATITALEAQREKNPKSYDRVISGTKTILTLLQKEIKEGPIVPEMIVRKLMTARDDLLDLFMANLSDEEILNLNMPDYRSQVCIAKYRSYSYSPLTKFDYPQSPAALFQLFDNFRSRALLKREIANGALLAEKLQRCHTIAEVEKGSYELVGDYLVEVGKRLSELPERLFSRALREDFPDIAQELITSDEMHLYEAVIEHYAHPKNTHTAKVKAIALALERPQCADKYLKWKVKSNFESREACLQAQKEAISTFNPKLATFFSLCQLVREVIDNIPSKFTLAQAQANMKPLLSKLIPAAKEAFEDEQAKNIILVNMGQALLKAGLFEEAIIIHLEVRLSEKDEGWKEQQSFWQSILNPLLKSNLFETMYLCLDRLPIEEQEIVGCGGALVGHLNRMLHKLNRMNHKTKINELMIYALQRDVINPLSSRVGKLNLSDHTNLVISFIYHGTRPSNITGSLGVLDLIEATREQYLRIFRQMIIAEMPCEAMGGKDVANLAASYLNPDSYLDPTNLRRGQLQEEEAFKPEQMITLARMCLSADPELAMVPARIKEREFKLFEAQEE